MRSIMHTLRRKKIFKNVLKTFLLIAALLLIIQHLLYDWNVRQQTPSESKEILFVETRAGKRHLTPLEACSMEAAARHHPHSRVLIFNTGRVHRMGDPYVQTLLNYYSNIRFLKLNLDELFSETPLHVWHRRRRIDESKFPAEHLSDAVRIALVWKRGGIYLDSDVISLTNFDRLENSLGLEWNNVACNAVLIFKKGHFLLPLYMHKFSTKFNGNEFDFQGPVMLTSILKQMCDNVASLAHVVNDRSACLGINIHPIPDFYPVSWKTPRLFLLPQKESGVNLSKSYVVHVYRNVHNRTEPVVKDNSLLGDISRQHCPHTHQITLKDGILQHFYFKK